MIIFKVGISKYSDATTSQLDVYCSHLSMLQLNNGAMVKRVEKELCVSRVHFNQCNGLT